jgi:hypothetical protein
MLVYVAFQQMTYDLRELLINQMLPLLVLFNCLPERRMINDNLFLVKFVRSYFRLLFSVYSKDDRIVWRINMSIGDILIATLKIWSIDTFHMSSLLYSLEYIMSNQTRNVKHIQINSIQPYLKRTIPSQIRKTKNKKQNNNMILSTRIDQ